MSLSTVPPGWSQDGKALGEGQPDIFWARDNQETLFPREY